MTRPMRCGREPTLESITELPGYVYLGSPYSKFPAGLDEACRQVQLAAANLMLAGVRIFCPIAHSHGIGKVGHLDNKDWTFWRAQDHPLMVGASAMIVLKMEGWRESVGLNDEIDTFTLAGKPILYLDPKEVGL